MSDRPKGKGASGGPLTKASSALRVGAEKAQEGIVRKAVEANLGRLLERVTVLLVAHGMPPGAAAAFTAFMAMLNFGVSAGVAGGLLQRLREHPDPKVRNAGAWGAAVFPSDEQAFQEFLQQARDPAARESLLESFEGAARALDGEVAACVGRLGRVYASEGRGPDRFFRSCAGVFVRIDRRDLESMRKALAEVLALFDQAGAEPGGHGPLHIQAGGSNLRDGRMGQVDGFMIGTSTNNPSAFGPRFVAVPDARRVHALLTELLLGSVDPNVSVEAADILRLARVVNP